MRKTIFTPTPTNLEIQPEEVTDKMERDYNELYQFLNEHVKEWHDAGWFNTSREQRLLPGNPLAYIQKVKDDEVLLEMIPESITTYTREGIKGSDMVVIWADNYRFVPITFEEYDRLYNKVFDKRGILGLRKGMLEALKGVLDKAEEAVK